MDDKMDIRGDWRDSLNEVLIWSDFDRNGSGWLCIFHDVPAPSPFRLGLVVENGRITAAKDLLAAPAFPAPATLTTIEAARTHILGCRKDIAIVDALAAVAPLPRWREPASIADAAPFSLPARIAWRFHAKIGERDTILAARLPLDELYEAARRHIHDNRGVARLLERLDLDALQRLAHAPFHLNDAASLDWHGVWGEQGQIPDEIRQRRRQAAEAAPFLAGILPHFPALRTAVDQAQPLFEAAAKILNMPAAQLATIAGLRLPMAAGRDAGIDSFIGYLRALRDIPTDWLRAAKTDTDLDALSLALTMARQAASLGLPQQLPLGKAGGKWSDHITRVAKNFTDRRPPEGLTAEDYATLKERLSLDAIAKARPIAREAVARFQIARLPLKAENANLEEIAAWAARIATPDTRPAALEQAIEGVRAMGKSFASRIVLPLLMNEAGVSGTAAMAMASIAERIAADLLFNGKAAPRVMETTRAYFNQEPRILGGAAEEVEIGAQKPKTDDWTLSEAEKRRFGLTGEDDKTWPMVAKPVIAPNGLAIVPLWSRGHLQDEGRGWSGDRRNADGSEGLAICVGIHGYYLANCLNAKTQILSIRRLPEGGGPVTRLSCVELEVRSPDDIRSVQHRGLRNATPPAEACHALSWWLDEFGTTIAANPLWRDFVAKGGYGGVTRLDYARVACGYDWRKRANIERAWAPWRDVLGKDIPEIAAILNHPEARRAIAEFSPMAAMTDAPRP